MYGLFRVYHDYYKFEELVIVSNSKYKLNKYFNDNHDRFYDHEPLVPESKVQELDDAEESYHVIVEIECI